MADEIRRETTAGTTPGGQGHYPGSSYGGPSYGGPSYGGPSYGGGYSGPPSYGPSAAPYTGGGRTPIFRRVSWGAIFAGTFVALALSALLWLLGTAIGLAAFDPNTPAGEGWAWGIGIWGILVAMISLFSGGLVAAWLAAFPKWMDAMLHGVVVWALATTAGFLLTATIGAGALGALGTSGTQTTMSPQQTGSIFATDGMRENPRETVREELKDILPHEDDWTNWGNESNVTYTDRDIEQMVAAIQRGSGQDIVGLLVRDGEMDRQTAMKRVEEWQGVLRGETQVTSREALDTATAAAVWSFLALLLGACAAAVGGAIGRPAYFEDRIMEGGHPRYTRPNYQDSGYSGGHSGYSGGEGRYTPPPSY